MKTVLRIGGNEITHKYVCTTNGVGEYLTCADYDKFLDLNENDLSSYLYNVSGRDELIEDIGQLITGELGLGTLKLRLFIAKYGYREIFRVTPD